MKMKYKLYIVIFMVMCILPFAGMAVAKTETTTENRTMAAFPSFMEEGKWNVNYLQDLGAYFEDHYAFRNLLVSVDSQIQAKLFKTSIWILSLWERMTGCITQLLLTTILDRT